VAVVDDQRLVLEGITSRLSAQSGIQVVASECTWIGLLCHPEFPVDVVVLDLNLKDQISIGNKLKTLTAAGCRSIVMSRHSDATSIFAAISFGAKGFVPKSESADELVRAIHCAALDRRYDNRSMTDAMEVAGRGTAPRLGNQERRALMLYAAGRPVKEVAATMQTTEDTVKSYIKRGRRKYRAAGIDIGTRILLRRRAIMEGWLSPE
jgi:DNA-binding NarL/FixJ family response regulator